MESKNNWKAWLYLAPTLLLMVVFTFYPIFNSFIIAFLKDYTMDVNGAESVIHSIFKEGGGLTLRNFTEILGITSIGTRPDGTAIKYEMIYKVALPNTLLLTVITVPCSVILALLISVGLNAIPVFKKFFQTVFFLPYVTNSIAVGMVFAVIFSSRNGLWNTIFGLGDLNWIDQGAQGFRPMFALCLFIIWNSLPYKILIFLSGLQGIDKQYYQAAKIDSASKFKTFMRVTVPLLSPQILYITITSLIGSFKEYSAVVGLFNGPGTTPGGTGPKGQNMLTMVYFIVENLRNLDSIEYSAAGAVVLFAIIMVFTVIQNQVSKKRVHY